MARVELRGNEQLGDYMLSVQKSKSHHQTGGLYGGGDANNLFGEDGSAYFRVVAGANNDSSTVITLAKSLRNFEVSTSYKLQ